ncbi:hypothetical protein D9M68_680480 [compost metagenome]
MQQRARQLEGRGVAVFGQLREPGAAGVRQAHELGALVEGLAGRVVDGLAEQFVAAHAVDPHQLRVAARHQQRHERKFGRVGAQERRQQMPFEVMHPQHRLAQRHAERAGHAGAHEQRAGQAGPARVGHHVELGQRAPGLGHDGFGERQHAADVVAAGQLGHHAAVGLVHGDLAVQRVRTQQRQRVAVRLDQRHAGLVAG